jgi:hypothetical protein
MEVSDRNRCVEDADAVVVPGLFFFSEGSVCMVINHFLAG